MEYRNDLDSSLAPSGHQYAVSRAAACTGRSKAVDEIWNGLTQVRHVRELSDGIHDPRFAAELTARLEGIRERLAGSGMIINLTGTAPILETMLANLEVHLAGVTAPVPPSLAVDRRFYELVSPLPPAGDPAFFSPDTSAVELVTASLQVGFAAAVLPSPRYGTPDQPVDTVFGHWLASGLLWEKIRTAGGAYGAFSYPDSLEDIFVLSTYRDPMPLKSLEVFREALELAAGTTIDELSLEKTVTGCYSREIQPRSPSDKGFTAFIRILYGITDGIRRKKIERIVAVTPEDMQICAKRLLADWPSMRAALLAGKKQLKDSSKKEFSGKVKRSAI